MSLPYENSTSGQKALGDMQKLLKDFGATSFGFMDDFASGDLIVQFRHRDRNVTVRASAKGYAAAWIKHHPRGGRARGTVQAYHDKALKIGQLAVYSILRDWLKGQITAIETGMMSFEGAFLGQLHLPSGETVLERLQSTNILQITDERGS